MAFEIARVARVVVIGVAVALLVGALVGCGGSSDGNGKPEPPPPDPPGPGVLGPDTEPTEEGMVKIAPIALEQVSGFWVEPPTLTDIQKKSFEQDKYKEWKRRFTGKWVRWKGTVKDIVGSEGKLVVELDLKGYENPKTRVELHLAKESSDKAHKIGKTHDITFVGKLNQIPTKPWLPWVPWLGKNSTVMLEKVIIK